MSNGQYTAVVTGGSGFVGRYLLRELANGQVFSVIHALTRDPEARFEKGVQPVVADIAHLPLSLPRADVLFHFAGEKRDESKMQQSNVEGTRQILQWALTAGVKRVVYLSSVGVYGAPMHAGNVNERTPHVPQNLYESTKSEAEALLAGFCQAHGIDYVILQPSNVIGWGQRGERPLLGFLRNAVAGRVPVFGGGEAILNYVEVADVARAAAFFSDRPGQQRTCILNRSASIRDVLDGVSGQLGTPRNSLRMPRGLGALLACTGDILQKARLRFPFDSARLRELTNTTRYDGSAIERETGFQYRHDAVSAVVNLAVTYREHGLL